MDGFERRKEHSKEDIRKASAKLFSQFGITRVSTKDIARKAGVSQATIYNNFGNKGNLVKDYMLARIDRRLEQGRKILNSKMSYVDKLEAFFHQFMQLGEPNDASKLDHTEIPANIDLLNDPEVKYIHDLVMQKLGDLLMEFVREGKKQGCVKADLSEEAVKVMFSIVLSDPELHRRLHHEPALVKDLFSLLIYGLSGESR